jgi:hypothetical protein
MSIVEAERDSQICTPAAAEINRSGSSTWSITDLVYVGQISMRGRLVSELIYICGNNIFFRQFMDLSSNETNKEGNIEDCCVF